MPLEVDSFSLRNKYAYDLLSSPDNEDSMKKLAYGGAYGLYAGVGGGFLECLVKQKAFTPSVVGFSMAGWAGPLVAIGVAYPTLTCTFSNMRGGKDDVLNHAAAGFISGSIYGIRYRKTWIAYLAAFSFGTFCAINKYCHIKGYELYPKEIYNVPSGNSHFNHYNRSFLATRGPVLGNQND